MRSFIPVALIAALAAVALAGGEKEKIPKEAISALEGARDAFAARKADFFTNSFAEKVFLSLPGDKGDAKEEPRKGALKRLAAWFDAHRDAEALDGETKWLGGEKPGARFTAKKGKATLSVTVAKVEKKWAVVEISYRKE